MDTNPTKFTFKVDDVNISRIPPECSTADVVLTELVGLTNKIEDFSHKDNNEEAFVFDGIPKYMMPGLILALHTAYQEHYPLKLSVSDFIILIGQGLGKHIEKYAEELRKYFVDHEGKELIQIRRDEFIKGQRNDWSTVFGEFATEIKKRVKTDIYDIVVDDTSVATPTSRIVSEIALMDCMKNYFRYEVCTLCGIPEITLVGSSDDWEKLRAKVQKLADMNKGNCLKLDWWLKKLIPVVNTICDTAVKREADKAFWSGIYKYEDPGSGGPMMSGWITVFLPYLTGGVVNEFKEGWISTGKVPQQISKVSFIWKYYFESIPMSFYGGFLGAYYNKEENNVEPAHFWSVIYDKPNE